MKTIRLVSALLVFALLFNTVSGQSQTQIRGEVVDLRGKPIPHANVLLLSSTDSSLVLGAVSEENGQFQFHGITKDSYLLSISMVGFKKHYEPLEIAKDTNIELHAITLHEDEGDLEEIVISAQKPLYETQMDRMIINVQESITAAGSTVLQILQKSPGVMVNQQNNSIMLNGKTGVAVMINNNISRLPIDAVVQMLDGLSAANVEKIELITTPPAKYDAEGTAGIIHIVMLENADLGTNGNFGVTAGLKGRETLGTSFNLNHRSRNISFFTDYSLHYEHNSQDWENDLQIAQLDYTSRFHSTSKRIPRTTVQNFRIGSEVQVNPKTTVGALVTLYQRRFNMDALTKIFHAITPDSSRTGDVAIGELNRWQSFTANVNLSYSIDDKNSVRVDLDYLKFHNKNPSDYANNFFYPEQNLRAEQKIDIGKMTPINFKVIKVDYTYQPFESVLVEAGIKSTMSEFLNDVQVMYTEGGIQRKDPELSTTADLDENITAAYASLEWRINGSNQLHGGLRYEHTSTYISTQPKKGDVDRDFGNIFPSLLYSKTFSDNLDVTFSYSRRITRPTFNDMAPFVFMVDPNTFFSGNPALQPAIIDGLKLDVKIKQAVVSLGYSDARNQIVNFQPEIDILTNKQVLRSQNLEFEKLYNINLSVPVTLTDWWDVQANTSGFYRKFKTAHLDDNLTRDFTHFNFNLVNTIILPKDFSLELVGFYESKMIWGLWEFRPLGSLNIGIQKKLKENKGVFRLSMDDIFYTNIWKMYSSMPESQINSFLLGDMHNQSFRLNYTRSFGNKKLEAVKIESGSEEERKRVQ